MPGKYALFTTTKTPLLTDFVFKVPALRYPETYKESLRIEIGKAFIDAFLQKRKAQFVPEYFLNRVGIYFVHYINQLILSNADINPVTFFVKLMEPLTHILHYQSYRDPDSDLEKLDMTILKKDVGKRLHAMFSPLNRLQIYYQIIAILIHGLHLHLPHRDELSLQNWEKVYHLIFEKMEAQRISLQTFFPQMNEAFKVKNLKRMKFIYSTPFSDFKPEVLLQIAKMVKLMNKKFEPEKKACLHSIQQHLTSTKQGVSCLKQMFFSRHCKLNKIDSNPTKAGIHP